MKIHCHKCNWKHEGETVYGACPQCESRDLSPEADSGWYQILKRLWAGRQGWGGSTENLAIFFLRHPETWEKWLQEKRWLSTFSEPMPANWPYPPGEWAATCIVDRWKLNFHTAQDLLNKYPKIAEIARAYIPQPALPRETPKHGAIEGRPNPPTKAICTRCTWESIFEPNVNIPPRCPKCDSTSLVPTLKDLDTFELWARSKGYSRPYMSMNLAEWIHREPGGIRSWEDEIKSLESFNEPCSGVDPVLFFYLMVQRRWRIVVNNPLQLEKYGLLKKCAERYLKKQPKRPAQQQPGKPSWTPRGAAA